MYLHRNTLSETPLLYSLDKEYAARSGKLWNLMDYCRHDQWLTTHLQTKHIWGISKRLLIESEEVVCWLVKKIMRARVTDLAVSALNIANGNLLKIGRYHRKWVSTSLEHEKKVWEAMHKTWQHGTVVLLSPKATAFNANSSEALHRCPLESLRYFL